jgi:hypothetical protein
MGTWPRSDLYPGRLFSLCDGDMGPPCCFPFDILNSGIVFLVAFSREELTVKMEGEIILLLSCVRAGRFSDEGRRCCVVLH